MIPQLASNSAALGPFEQLRFAREILRREAQAVLGLAETLGDEFLAAVQLFRQCSGSVIVTGIGKAGHVARKLSATFCSTGTRSHFLHPAEALHGDLGRVDERDVLLVLSHSGETEEIVRLLPLVRGLGATLVAATAQPRSTLARSAAVVLDLGRLEEACALGLAPSTSTTVMLALGDALALTVSRLKQFTPADFARYHPGGNLGRKLARVEDHMRPLGECRVASATCSVREVFVGERRAGRRTGAVMLTGDAGRLVGIFTDSDLARLLEQRREGAIDGPVSTVMTRSPRTVQRGEPMSAAVAILAERKISELPVIDGSGRPVGLIDITDVVGLLPHDEHAPAAANESEQVAQSAGSGGVVEPKGAEFRCTTVPFRTNR